VSSRAGKYLRVLLTALTSRDPEPTDFGELLNPVMNAPGAHLDQIAAIIRGCGSYSLAQLLLRHLRNTEGQQSTTATRLFGCP
jgi:hypothetical protein